jgi:hypothetical protein
MTINLLDDQSLWIKGSIPPPLDKCKSTKKDFVFNQLLEIVYSSV